MQKLRKSENDRIVLGYKAYNESLPFKDATFDCYISGYSLNLVNDSKAQLREAYRVLKQDSYAALSIWGRK